jgi:hypothetical protein
MKDTDQVHHEQNDIIKLKDLEAALGKDGTTTEDQDYAVMCAIRDIMRDLAQDPMLDPVNVTARGLQKKGYPSRLIAEEMKLKKIYDEVKSGNPVDIKHLRHEIDAVMAEMADDVKDANPRETRPARLPVKSSEEIK